MRPNSLRVLVLGGTGMLGGMLLRNLVGVTGWRVRSTQRREPESPGYFDASAPGRALDALLDGEGGTDFVLNAIGLTKAELDERDPASATAAEAINGRFPHLLAASALKRGVRMIHVSTDGVFSGRSGPYDELSTPDPQDLYGRTKLAGEPTNPRVLTLRCSIIGPDPANHRGLFEWFRQQTPGARLGGYTDQRWNGVTTKQLADLCRALIDQDQFDRVTALAPLRHFCPNHSVTKHELLRLFQSALASDVTIEPTASGVRLNRELHSRWQDLTELVGGPTDMAEAVRAMVHALPEFNQSPGTS
jgi:dTDP-4-dehydrorhamnose reductase